MTVLVRSKRLSPRLARRRSAPAPQAPPPAAEAAVTNAARRQEQGPPHDRALYSCSCGFVFEAPVSTSVGCPHCGDTQAW